MQGDVVASSELEFARAAVGIETGPGDFLNGALANCKSSLMSVC